MVVCLLCRSSQSAAAAAAAAAAVAPARAASAALAAMTEMATAAAVEAAPAGALAAAAGALGQTTAVAKAAGAAVYTTWEAGATVACKAGQKVEVTADQALARSAKWIWLRQFELRGTMPCVTNLLPATDRLEVKQLRMCLFSKRAEVLSPSLKSQDLVHSPQLTQQGPCP